MIALCPPELKARVSEYLHERFGLDSVILAPYELYAGPNGRILLGPKTDFDPALVDTAGILIARIQRTVKPSTHLFQMFGHHVTANIVRLDRENVPRYCRGEHFALSPEEIGDSTRGFVMVAFGDLTLGCGLLKDGQLENQLPKQYRLVLDRY